MMFSHGGDSGRHVPVVQAVLLVTYAQIGKDVVATSNDMNATDSTGKDRAAILFLHSLGDSPQSWASLAEVLFPGLTR